MDLITFINKKNNKGITALHYASFRGNINVINNLILHGADIHAVTCESLNIIHFACQGNKPNVLVYLNLKYEITIDFNVLDAQKMSPLHWAAFVNAYECTQFLLYKNVELELKDNEGNTPLHLAVLGDNYKIVRLLLQKDVNTLIKNNKNETAIELAAKKKTKEIYNDLKNNNKCLISNFKVPLKKSEKNKKYIFIAIFYKFVTYFILFFTYFHFYIIILAMY